MKNIVLAKAENPGRVLSSVAFAELTLLTSNFLKPFCFTADVFYNDKYKVNTYMTNVSGHDSDRPFTRVLEGAVVQYWARQPDCFEVN